MYGEKKNKDKIVFSLFGIMLFFSTLIFFSSFVSAASPLDYYAEKLLNSASPVLNFLIGPIDSAGGNVAELLFVKFLVFLLLLAIVSFSLNRIPTFRKSKGVVIVLTIVVSLLGIRYLSTSALINFIWLPYGALGILLTSFITFIIFFYFIESFDEDIIRWIGWAAFIFVYLGLAYTRFEDLKVGNEWWENLAWIYLIIAIIGILVVIFEKSIRVRMILSAIKRGYEVDDILAKNEVKKRLDKINEALAHPEHHDKYDIERLKEEKSKLMKYLAGIR